jgi:phosphoglycolate phosphatase
MQTFISRWQMKNVLIFDYDGVIVDSLEIFMENFIEACNREGFRNIASKKEFLKLFEKNMYESMFEIGMSKEQILRIVNFMKDRLIENQHNLELFPGIKETIENLSKNNLLVIVTSNESTVVKEFLKLKKIDKFKDILGSEKEASKIAKIQKIKTDFNVDNHFYIGDTTGDIIEGKHANVRTVGVTWGWHSKSMLIDVKPDFLICKPSDLEKIIVG